MSRQIEQYTAKAGKLDARHYRWETWIRPSSGAFDFLKNSKMPVAVKDVEFDPSTFELTDYGTNGIHFSFYGSGRITDHAAVLCDDDTILFCVVSGTQFQGTFASADDIEMEYYKLTKI